MWPLSSPPQALLTFYYLYLYLTYACLKLAWQPTTYRSSTWIQNTTTPPFSFHFNFPPILSISPSFPVSIQANFFFYFFFHLTKPLSTSLYLFLPFCVCVSLGHPRLYLSFHSDFIWTFFPSFLSSLPPEWLPVFTFPSGFCVALIIVLCDLYVCIRPSWTHIIKQVLTTLTV